jgi:hypothetical protein
MADVTIRSFRKEREKEIIDGLQKGLEKAGLIVERQAKLNTGGTTNHPYRKSGRLVGSITHNVSPGEVEIGTNVYYGKYLEFGTSHHPPYPWLFPAVELKKPEIIEALKWHEFTIE